MVNHPHSKPAVKNQAERVGGELFIVATPIGNLGDITLRALETLKSADRIACEDTRTTRVLTQHYGIATPLTAYHEHNEARASAALVEEMLTGKRIALVSDAGTPLLSDPGGRLVGAAIAAGIRVTPIPGASALLSALTIAGLPALPFHFAGFLPPKSKARRDAFGALKPIKATLALYESPNRLVDALNDAADILGDRTAAVARELTKMHEECKRGTLRELAQHYATTKPRGECVLLIEGAGDAPAPTGEALDELLRRLLGTHSVKEAAAIAAAESGQSKSELYARALALRDGK
jgi:16S rRNA (cytidine1402-2'-O)-methyltransferase